MPNNTREVVSALDGIGALGGVYPNRLVGPPRRNPHARSEGSAETASSRFFEGPEGGSLPDIGWVLDPMGPESQQAHARSAQLAGEIGPIDWTSDTAGMEPGHVPVNGARVVDVAAWYAPIHIYAEDWGIFIKTSAIKSIAADLMTWASWLGNNPNEIARIEPEFIRGAVITLFHHELYHHKVESFIIRLELLLRDGGRWDLYHRGVYLEQLGRNIGPNEEALANAYELRRARRVSLPPMVRQALLKYLPESFTRQGPGYNRAILYVSDRKFTQLECFLMSEIEMGPFSDARRPSSSWLPFGLLDPLLNCRNRLRLWPD